jgi:hypothetical protein
VRALSIRQPWAFAIAAGFKPIENRSTTTTYRGPLALHAALTLDAPTFPFQTSSGRDAGRALDQLGWRDGFWDARTGDATGHPLLALGAVIAIADLVDVCTTGATGCACGPWAVPSQRHWRLANVRPLPRPIPWKGALGLWRIPDEVVSRASA